MPEDPAEDRVRREGAGRPKATESEPELESNLFSIFKNRTAGDPMRVDVMWTDLKLRQISDALGSLGTPHPSFGYAMQAEAIIVAGTFSKQALLLQCM